MHWILKPRKSGWTVMPLALPQGKKSILLPKFGNTERKSHSMSNADGIVGFSGSFLIANSSYWYIPSNHLWLSVCTWKRKNFSLIFLLSVQIFWKIIEILHENLQAKVWVGWIWVTENRLGLIWNCYELLCNDSKGWLILFLFSLHHHIILLVRRI